MKIGQIVPAQVLKIDILIKHRSDIPERITKTRKRKIQKNNFQL